MELQDRITALEHNCSELRAHQLVIFAEIEALMFCAVAALRCAPLEPAMKQLAQQIEKLRAMALASSTSDAIEEIRSSKAQQVYELVAAAVCWHSRLRQRSAYPACFNTDGPGRQPRGVRPRSASL